ncbi:methyltransferase domain-containing protein, partial [candidate division GN15 bacterium]|nr:methyltransferase domain-containing protein [candidate division GN15 bacterium]
MTTDASGYKAYPFVAEFYDHIPAYRSRPDIDFFVDLAKETGGPVLEIGCGTGRVLIPTARAGIDIVGLDLSPHMLEECRRRLAAEPDDVRDRVQLIEGDMARLDLNRTFKLITTPFRCFQHIMEVDQQLATLQAVRRHLDRDGLFVLDLFNPSIKILADDSRQEEHGEEPQFVLGDGRTVVRKMRVFNMDDGNQRFDCEQIYYVLRPDGTEERLVHAFNMRYL